MSNYKTTTTDKRCDACAACSETKLGVVTVQEEDEGNGWQTKIYCQECADALGYSDGDEISLEDNSEVNP